MSAQPASNCCLVCEEGAVVLRPAFESMLRVTSDSRIWRTGGKVGACAACGMVQKPADDRFLSDADEIYSSYEMYRQAGGHEQKIFTANGARPRSEVLLERLAQAHRFPAACRLLDVGCGAGNLLKAASKQMPGWDLYGNDISSHERENILAIAGVKGFFGGDVSTIRETFDVVCISHVLEHVPNPTVFLRQLMALLNPGGVLAVLVPHWPDNYFDLLVADHHAHFTAPHLLYLLMRSGFSIMQHDTALLPKEIFVLAQPASSLVIPSVPAASNAALNAALDWLQHTCDWAARQQGPIGILGTSLAATWLTQAAKLVPECYVDEDPDRQGRVYLGKPVWAPAQVPETMRVLIPLPPQIAQPLAVRLNRGRSSAVFFAPPVQEAVDAE